MEAPSRIRRVQIALGALFALLATLGAGQVAFAHTDFDSSVPTDGAVVEGPLSQVTVNFTNPAEPAGEGFELLDPGGSIRTPSSVDATDGTTFVLTFDPALEAGTYGFRWKVRAGDAHPIDGSFTFEVTVQPSEPTITVPAAAVTPASNAAAPVTVAPVVEDATPPAGDDAGAADGADASLDAFVNAGSAGSGGTDAVGRVGRTLTVLGTIFGIGVLAALIWTIRGAREELDAQLAWVRLAGLVVFTGGFIEYAAFVESDSGVALGDLFGTKPGVAAALKMVGGIAVVVGFHGRAGRMVAPAHSLSAAMATDLDADPATTSDPATHGEHRWAPTSAAAVGFAGYALVLASFWFDGHTVSKGSWVVHAAVNLVHLGAAAVWGGGVFAMTTVAWMRRRRSERLGLAAMVVRFSSLATVSLVAVIVAGLVMTWMILDTPGDLFGTQWGRLLIAKTAAVAVAAGLGGYNHLRLRPALERRPDDPALARELRISLAIESAVFVVVVALTSVLVAAAT